MLIKFFLNFSKMTDIDSSKVIEKLTEVLDLLKASKKQPEKKVECNIKCDEKCTEKCDEKCDEKCTEKCDEKCDEKCAEKCPLRKVLSPQEFDEFCKMAQSMKKEDLVKMCKKGECTGCPFMVKDVVFEEFDNAIDQKQKESRECFQVFNTILSIILLVLFVIFLVRAIKGFYCTV
jgi:hypothetical protein